MIPGTFSETAEALDGAHAVLITHEHADHVDVPAMVGRSEPPAAWLCSRRPAWLPHLREEAPQAAERIHAVEPGSTFDAAGFSVRSFGGQHALIHPQIPMVANIGYLVDGNVYHPGDSFIIPDGLSVQTLLVPIHAPWNKAGEVVDFVIGVRAPRAFQIHDGLLNETGLKMVEGHVARLGGKYGTTFTHLAPRESVEV